MSDQPPNSSGPEPAASDTFSYECGACGKSARATFAEIGTTRACAACGALREVPHPVIRIRFGGGVRRAIKSPTPKAPPPAAISAAAPLGTLPSNVLPPPTAPQAAAPLTPSAAPLPPPSAASALPPPGGRPPAVRPAKRRLGIAAPVLASLGLIVGVLGGWTIFYVVAAAAYVFTTDPVETPEAGTAFVAFESASGEDLIEAASEETEEAAVAESQGANPSPPSPPPPAPPSQAASFAAEPVKRQLAAAVDHWQEALRAVEKIESERGTLRVAQERGQTALAELAQDAVEAQTAVVANHRLGAMDALLELSALRHEHPEEVRALLYDAAEKARDRLSGRTADLVFLLAELVDQSPVDAAQRRPYFDGRWSHHFKGTG